MKGRYKAFVRGTSNKSPTGRYMINLPKEVMEDMGWEVNEHLQIDIIKYGMYHSVSITKEVK
jgi:hypothetical protein